MSLDTPVIWVVTWREILVTIVISLLFKTSGFFFKDWWRRFASNPLQNLFTICAPTALICLIASAQESAIQTGESTLLMTAGLVFAVIAGAAGVTASRRERRADAAVEEQTEKASETDHGTAAPNQKGCCKESKQQNPKAHE